MNQTTFHLEKILNFQKSERDIYQTRYGQSVQYFEEVGMELYNLLKKKEAFEEKQLSNLQTGIQLQEIQSSQRYLEKLVRQIEELQSKLIDAREQMNELKSVLVNKSIEVKKYEKLEERFNMQFNKELNRMEQATMDEISTVRTQQRN